MTQNLCVTKLTNFYDRYLIGPWGHQNIDTECSKSSDNRLIFKRHLGNFEWICSSWSNGYQWTKAYCNRTGIFTHWSISNTYLGMYMYLCIAHTVWHTTTIQWARNSGKRFGIESSNFNKTKTKMESYNVRYVKRSQRVVPFTIVCCIKYA